MAKNPPKAPEDQTLDLRSKILDLMGNLLMNRGDYEMALGYFRDRLTLCETALDWDALVETHLLMGHAYRMLNNLDKASDEYRLALAAGRQYDLKNRIGESLNNIASILYFQKELDKALEYYQAALTTLRENGRTALLGRTLMQIGNVHRKMEENKKSDRNYTEALKIFRELGDEYNMGMTLANRALLHFSLDEEDTAFSLIRDAFERLFYAGAHSEIQLFKATLETNFGIRYEES